MRGDMSSRKFLLLLAGMLAEGDTWLRRSMLADRDVQLAEDRRHAELLSQAEFKAQIHGAPLQMSDLR